MHFKSQDQTPFNHEPPTGQLHPPSSARFPARSPPQWRRLEPIPATKGHRMGRPAGNLLRLRADDQGERDVLHAAERDHRIRAVRVGYHFEHAVQFGSAFGGSAVEKVSGLADADDHRFRYEHFAGSVSGHYDLPSAECAGLQGGEVC